MDHEQPAQLPVANKLLPIAPAAFALLATTGGLAFSPVAFLGGIGMTATLGGMLTGVSFQVQLRQAHSPDPSRLSLATKVLRGLLLVFAVLCVITIVGVSFNAVCNKSSSMLSARRGHPNDVTGTLASCTALGVVAAVALASMTLFFRREALGTAALVMVYWASYVPISIAAVSLWGSAAPFGN